MNISSGKRIIRKYNRIFYKKFKNLKLLMYINKYKKIENLELKKEFINYLLEANIDFTDTLVLEAEKTEYDIAIKVLFINVNDSRKYVEYIVIESIIRRVINKMPKLEIRPEEKFYSLLVKLGFLKEINKEIIFTDSTEENIKKIASKFLEANI